METMELNRSFWRDRPTFVTGATGLLGSWLTQRLVNAGAKVICLIRDNTVNKALVNKPWKDDVAVVQGSLGNRAVLQDALKKHEVITVLHIAAQAIVTFAARDPITTFETNIAGSWNILESCRNCPSVKQIVVASSDKAYGNQDSLPYTEDMPLLGRQPYELSKAITDLISQTYSESYDMPIAITRCGNFYGGEDLNWNRIIPGTIRSILRGERPLIRSDGEYVRDYLYVEDGAAAYMLLAEQLSVRPEIRGQAYNFSNEIQVSVRETVERILKIMSSNLIPDIRNEVSNEIRHQYLSAKKARQELGWRPMFTLDEGLQRTIDWYKKYFNAVNHVN